MTTVMQLLNEEMQKELQAEIERLRNREKTAAKAADLLNEMIDELARSCRLWYRARRRGNTPPDLKRALITLSKRINRSTQRRPWDTQRLNAWRKK